MSAAASSTAGSTARRCSPRRARVGSSPMACFDALVKAAQKDGLVLSRQEIQRRIRCAEAYKSKADVSGPDAITDLGPPSGTPVSRPSSRTARTRGPRSRGARGASRLLGAAPARTPRTQAGAHDPEPSGTGRAWRGRCEGRRHPRLPPDAPEKHNNYGKTVDRIAETFAIILDGCGGDETMNAIEAFERGLALEAGDGPT